MEKYINENTIVKNEIYESFKDSIICPICLCIIIEPVMCLECQNNFCKKCIEDWKKKDESCPNKCSAPVFKDVIGKNNVITKCKFKCIKGCGEEIKFEDIKNHYNSDCLSKTRNIKVLNKEEVAKYKKKTGEEIARCSSNYYLYLFFNFINISYHIRTNQSR